VNQKLLKFGHMLKGVSYYSYILISSALFGLDHSSSGLFLFPLTIHDIHVRLFALTPTQCSIL